MKAIVTGSFDPITLGHMEVIKYACEKYDTVYVVALINENKEYMFTMGQKKKLIELSISGFENAVADSYSGLTADYMHNMGITKIVRGVRNDKDMEYEKYLAAKMKEYDDRFETEIIVCDKKYSYISSTEVRKRISKGDDISDLVPFSTISAIKEMIKR